MINLDREVNTISEAIMFLAMGYEIREERREKPYRLTMTNTILGTMLMGRFIFEALWHMGILEGEIVPQRGGTVLFYRLTERL